MSLKTTGLTLLKINIETMRFKELFIVLFIVLEGCGPSYDPELEHPDGLGKGFNLTELGSLVYSPWEVSGSLKNISLIVHDSVILSYGKPYSLLEQNLVFELHKDHTAKYWVKNGYGSSMLRNPSLVKKMDSVFDNGKWTVSLSDSNINISFDNQIVSIPPLAGKYKKLGSDELELQKITTFDSIINNKNILVKRVETLHYWHLRK